jgi:hypothetical protein
MYCPNCDILFMHFSIYAIGEKNGNGAERLLYEGR